MLNLYSSVVTAKKLDKTYLDNDTSAHDDIPDPKHILPIQAKQIEAQKLDVIERALVLKFGEVFTKV